jgi:hypothetical protein
MERSDVAIAIQTFALPGPIDRGRPGGGLRSRRFRGQSGERHRTELTASAAFPGFVTDPLPSALAGSAESGDPDGVYISMPPGVSPSAIRATMSNYRTHRSVSTALVDGGFDPVRLEARAADTVVVTFLLRGGGTQLTWKIVPSARRPVVVRTNPASSKRDVPLESSMLIVFSEPIDPASLSTGTIALMQGDRAISGTAEVLPKEPWVVRFTPDDRLASGATYELVVAAQVRDLDGEGLESAARASFTTRSTTQPVAGRLAFSTWSESAFTIYTMNGDGSGLVGVASGLDPSFSPDGTRIAFWRYEPQVGSGVIYVANADGTRPGKSCPTATIPRGPPTGAVSCTAAAASALSTSTEPGRHG